MQLYYLKRCVNINPDVIKLRYGEDKKECPQLWKMMKQYIQLMATYFHGLVLINTQQIPINVSEYLMRKAKNIKKDLLVFADLQTGKRRASATQRLHRAAPL